MRISRCQFFRQIVSSERRKPVGCGANLVQDGGKDASEMCAEPLGMIYSVVPWKREEVGLWKREGFGEVGIIIRLTVT